jgi:hypothetical protein
MGVKITKNKDKVRWFLENKPETRDSDNKLIAQFWGNEAKRMGHDVKHITASGFLRLMSEGKLTSSESIRRCRQKVQEEEPKLRGENYKGKQKHQEKVQEELGYKKSN